MKTRKPLAGKTLCCTGVETKTRLQIIKNIDTLGGINYDDLMTDVQYLIVGNRKTEKYKFCIKYRPDIIFLTQDSIIKAYENWKIGEIDEIRLEDYKLPIFDEINTCFSRVDLPQFQIKNLINNASFRKSHIREEEFTSKKLMQSILDNGGKAKESLSNNQDCMISADPRGTRYDKAIEWKIPVVHPIWILDSILRGAALDFEDYILQEDNDQLYEKGCNDWNEIINPKPIKEKLPPITTNKDLPKKVNKSHKAEIWNSIMDNTKVQKKSKEQDSTWNDEESDSENEEPLKPTTTIDKKSKSTLFLGFCFLFVGLNSRESELLSERIETFQGEITKDVYDNSITHILVSANQGNHTPSTLKLLPSETKQKITNGEIKLVTEFFIERCIFYQKVILDRWGQPIKGLIQSTKKFKISTTGFTGIELLHIGKLIKFLNFEYCESLSDQRDLLILNINLFKESFMKNSPKLFQYKCKDILNCPTYQSGQSSVSLLSAKSKIDAAKKWNIPIVSIGYLWEIFEISRYKSILLMPEISNQQWCIYAPINYTRPKSLIEYIKNLNEEAFVTKSIEKGSDDENLIKLPSPKKIKTKQKYGKLIGTSSPQSIRNKLIEISKSNNSIGEMEENNQNKENYDITIDEDLSSQIRYEDDESMNNQERLLKKLDNSLNKNDEMELVQIRKRRRR
ncbi:DPB11 [Candida pseudojiufengensis]|uniref:DPB11 n=1 Tax=Candida pseudojiufengensis TaxID=497109 RepID=UPI0022240D7E|nr:DPB11 [Candida pseudojiufengensis]KAI5960078.1 DPB11 [Candida pseudojiufengensis]